MTDYNSGLVCDQVGLWQIYCIILNITRNCTDAVRDACLSTYDGTVRQFSASLTAKT